MEIKRLGIERKIIIEELELTEPFEISRLIKKYKFDEIYNLGAQSFVKSHSVVLYIHVTQMD